MAGKQPMVEGPEQRKIRNFRKNKGKELIADGPAAEKVAATPFELPRT
jgi:hypothetical protein